PGPKLQIHGPGWEARAGAAGTARRDHEGGPSERANRHTQTAIAFGKRADAIRARTWSTPGPHPDPALVVRRDFGRPARVERGSDLCADVRAVCGDPVLRLPGPGKGKQRCPGHALRPGCERDLPLRDPVPAASHSNFLGDTIKRRTRAAAVHDLHLHPTT